MRRHLVKHWTRSRWTSRPHPLAPERKSHPRLNRSLFCRKRGRRRPLLLSPHQRLPLLLLILPLLLVMLSMRNSQRGLKRARTSQRETAASQQRQQHPLRRKQLAKRSNRNNNRVKKSRLVLQLLKNHRLPPLLPCPTTRSLLNQRPLVTRNRPPAVKRPLRKRKARPLPLRPLPLLPQHQPLVQRRKRLSPLLSLLPPALSP
uniref:Uncharacterized protein n=1 Tax=Cacopsylla melanoneura TaxID=428564 RepID=A0A8D9AWG1_9HEMI